MAEDHRLEHQARVHFEDGMYWVEVPDLPGLFASGETPEELNEALSEALSMYWSDAEQTANVRLEPWSDEALAAFEQLRSGATREHDMEFALA
jgi:predicted RNase H-like HicB family nuclease